MCVFGIIHCIYAVGEVRSGSLSWKPNMNKKMQMIKRINQLCQRKNFASKRAAQIGKMTVVFLKTKLLDLASRARGHNY